MENAFAGSYETGGSQLIGPQFNATTVNIGSGTNVTPKDKKAALLDSLKFEHIKTRWSSIKQEHVHTCAWLLEEPEFQDWFAHSKAQDNHGFLWIKGKPGCGKSTLMKYVFLATRKKLKGFTVASFFFNARGAELEKSTIGMYRSLLWQLLGRQSLDFISKILKDVMLDDDCTDTSPWTLESLEDLFRAVIKELRHPVACFIDALDECDEKQIRQMVLLFQQLGQIAIQHEIRFQVCFSSRHYPHISIRRAQELILDGRPGHNQDITNYIGDVLDIGTGTPADEVRAEVQRKSGGVFMWVVLVVDLLNIEYDHGRMSALRRRLQEIPGELSTLFRQILTRHCENAEQIILCLQWLLFAKEPLQPRQLYCAVLAETDQDIVVAGQQSTDIVKKFVLSSSKGLAEIVESSESPSTVQFIHESVRDFLLKEKGLQELWSGLRDEPTGRSHDRLKQCCVSYLAAFKASVLTHASISKQGSKPLLSGDLKPDLDKHPFLRYAADNVLFHAEKAACCRIPQECFLEGFDCLTWITLYNTFQTKKSRLHIAEARLLYILAEVNAPNLIIWHPLRYSYLEVGEERCGTPLYVALAAGNHDVVQFFLELHSEGLPLDHAARCCLTEYRSTGTKVSKSRWTTPYKSNRDVLSQVLDYGDDIASAVFLHTATREDLAQLKHSRDNRGRTTLALAAIEGSYEIVKLLLRQHRMDPNAQDKSGRSALHHAVLAGHTRVARLLLECDMIKINLRDNNGDTPLALAAQSIYRGRGSQNKPVDVLKVLLEFDALQIQSVEQSGRSSVICDEAHNRGDSIELLSNTRRLDIDSRDSHGRSPLSHAAKWGHEGVVSILLETNKVDIDSRDSHGRSPFSYAAMGGYDGIVRILLKTGNVDIDSRDNDGESPLSHAARTRREGIVRILLETGKVDIDSRDSNGRSPLSHAAGTGSEGIIRILLKTGKVDADSRDNDGRSPLSHAARTGSEGIVRILLETGEVDVDSRDVRGRTPFSWAGSRPWDVEHAVRTWKYLLETCHADPASKDNDSRSPFWYAVVYFEIEMVEFFQTLGVDLNSRDIHGISPLQVAAFCENRAAVLKLLEMDDIDIREGDWARPAAELFPDIYPFTHSFNGSSKSEECFQLIKDKWLARQEKEAIPDNPGTSLKRSRERAFSIESESLSVRNAKR
jgi:ankyrin repeat protein